LDFPLPLFGRTDEVIEQPRCDVSELTGRQNPTKILASKNRRLLPSKKEKSMG
jgi:hypothetical protein